MKGMIEGLARTVWQWMLDWMLPTGEYWWYLALMGLLTMIWMSFTLKDEGWKKGFSWSGGAFITLGVALLFLNFMIRPLRWYYNGITGESWWIFALGTLVGAFFFSGIIGKLFGWWTKGLSMGWGWVVKIYNKLVAKPNLGLAILGMLAWSGLINGQMSFKLTEALLPGIIPAISGLTGLYFAFTQSAQIRENFVVFFQRRVHKDGSWECMEEIDGKRCYKRSKKLNPKEADYCVTCGTRWKYDPWDCGTCGHLHNDWDANVCMICGDRRFDENGNIKCEKLPGRPAGTPAPGAPTTAPTEGQPGTPAVQPAAVAQPTAATPLGGMLQGNEQVQVCPNGHENPAGTVVCMDCGESFLEINWAQVATERPAANETAQVATPKPIGDRQRDFDLADLI